jgi:hypothetical protein
MRPTLAAILLDTAFGRIVRGVSNAASCHHPVIFHLARGAKRRGPAAPQRSSKRGSWACAGSSTVDMSAAEML